MGEQTETMKKIENTGNINPRAHNVCRARAPCGSYSMRAWVHQVIYPKVAF